MKKFKSVISILLMMFMIISTNVVSIAAGDSVSVTDEASLKQAIANASTNANSPTIIELQNDIDCTDKIEIIGASNAEKYIEIHGDYTIKLTEKKQLYADHKTNRSFVIVEYANVVLKDVEINANYAAVDDNGGYAGCLFVKDGSVVMNGTAKLLNGGRLQNSKGVGFSLFGNAKLEMNDDAAISGSKTWSNVPKTAVGYIKNGNNEFVMNGGEISGNETGSSGLIYVNAVSKKGDIIELNKGKIINNTYNNIAGANKEERAIYIEGADTPIEFKIGGEMYIDGVITYIKNGFAPKITSALNNEIKISAWTKADASGENLNPPAVVTGTEEYTLTIEDARKIKYMNPDSVIYLSESVNAVKVYEPTGKLPEGGVELNVDVTSTSDSIKVVALGTGKGITCILTEIDSVGKKKVITATNYENGSYEAVISDAAGKTYLVNFINSSGVPICDEYIYDGSSTQKRENSTLSEDEKVVSDFSGLASFTSKTITITGKHIVGGRVYVELEINDDIKCYEAVDCNEEGIFTLEYDYSGDEADSTYRVKLYEMCSALQIKQKGMSEESALEYYDVRPLSSSEYKNIVDGAKGLTTRVGLENYISETQYASDAFGINLSGEYSLLNDGNKDTVMLAVLELIEADKADEVSAFFNSEVSRLHKGEIDTAILKEMETAKVSTLTGIFTRNKKDIGFSDELWKKYNDKDENWERINEEFLKLGKCTSMQDIIDNLEKAIEEADKPVEEEEDYGGYTPKPGNGGGGGRGGFTYSTPTAPIEEMEPIKPVTFSDVSTDHWGYEAITTLATQGVINGTGDGEFEPEAVVTREQFVKMLIEAFDLKSESTEINFSDVVKDEWYYPYIETAISIGLSNGYGDTFGIGEALTREQMATMAYRAADIAGIELPKKNEAIEFTDADKIEDYAEDAVDALTMAGIINGMSDNSFQPQGECTRAMAAKVIFEMLSIK